LKGDWHERRIGDLNHVPCCKRFARSFSPEEFSEAYSFAYWIYFFSGKPAVERLEKVRKEKNLELSVFKSELDARSGEDPRDYVKHMESL